MRSLRHGEGLTVPERPDSFKLEPVNKNDDEIWEIWAIIIKRFRVLT